MPNHTRQVKVAYALAAVPAVFLPISYAVMAVWVFTSLGIHLLSGAGAWEAEPTGVLRWVLLAGVYDTVVQWPFYLLWAASSRQLTLRVRVLWVVVLVSLNMFAIPWFLYCKYRGTAQTALTRAIRGECIRRFFEKRTGPGNDVA